MEGSRAQVVGLPDRFDGDGASVPWHPMTAQWWSTIWASPMAGEWVDADVPGLLRLAAQVEDFWRAATITDRTRAHAEIRMAQREFGLSPLARRMLQWEIVKTEGAIAEAERRKPPTKPVADPRSMLKAV
jgi:hypothetical protein